MGWRARRRWLERAGDAAGVVGVLAVTLTGAVLAAALLTNDFRFAYVTQYSSRSLSWYYALSAFWVGQAGSLLLWAWLVGILAIIYRFWPRRTPSPLGPPALAILMAYQCFLAAMMLFGTNPMEPSLTVPHDGAGLSPLLQHPAMLLHPPVMFLGYAACAIPFALAAAALREQSVGRGLGPRGPAVDLLRLGRTGNRASSWGEIGHTKNSAGAAIGIGTRWKTAR